MPIDSDATVKEEWREKLVTSLVHARSAGLRAGEIARKTENTERRAKRSGKRNETTGKEEVNGERREKGKHYPPTQTSDGLRNSADKISGSLDQPIYS